MSLGLLPDLSWSDGERNSCIKINLSNTSLQLSQKPPTMVHRVSGYLCVNRAFCNMDIIFVGYNQSACFLSSQRCYGYVWDKVLHPLSLPWQRFTEAPTWMVKSSHKTWLWRTQWMFHVGSWKTWGQTAGSPPPALKIPHLHRPNDQSPAGQQSVQLCYLSTSFCLHPVHTHTHAFSTPAPPTNTHKQACSGTCKHMHSLPHSFLQPFKNFRRKNIPEYKAQGRRRKILLSIFSPQKRGCVSHLPQRKMQRNHGAVFPQGTNGQKATTWLGCSYGLNTLTYKEVICNRHVDGMNSEHSKNKNSADKIWGLIKPRH